MHCATRPLVGPLRYRGNEFQAAFALSCVTPARVSRLRTSPPSLTASGAVMQLDPARRVLVKDWGWPLRANSCWRMVDASRSRASRVKEQRLRSSSRQTMEKRPTDHKNDTELWLCRGFLLDGKPTKQTSHRDQDATSHKNNSNGEKLPQIPCQGY